MVRRLIWLNFSILCIVALTCCGGKDTGPVQVISQDMETYPEEGVIVVKGVAQNMSESPELVYLYVSLYGDFGMVVDNKKKLLNGGQPLQPGDKIDFTMEFPFNEEVKKAKAKIEAK